MIFIDPDKLEILVHATMDCLVEIKESSGLKVKPPSLIEREVREQALGFLSILSKMGPVIAGNTVYCTGFGTDMPSYWPPNPVKFGSKKL